MASATKVLVDRVLTALYAREPHAKVVVAATGGGTSVSELLFRGGSSSTMLHFTVPYARASLERFLSATSSSTSSVSAASAPLPKFVSREMAERMAQASWHHAQTILWDQDRDDDACGAHTVASTLSRFNAAIGVGCTAALATNYERRGVNQAFLSTCRVVATSSAGVDMGAQVHQLQCETFHLHLDKTLARTREQEDRVVAQLLVYLLGRASGVEPDACAALLETLVEHELCGAADKFELVSPDPSPSAGDESLLAGLSSSPTTFTSVAFLPSLEASAPPVTTTVVRDFPFKGIVVSGSFNPLHQGHIDLVVAAQRVLKTATGTQLPVAFEIAVANADKGAIATSTVLQRVQQFNGSAATTTTTGAWPVLVTNATLFSQKAQLLQGCVFVIGADTAVRLVDKKYYGQDEHKMVVALRQIADNGGSFVVAGRFDEKETKRFISADEVLQHHVPAVLQSMFVALREEDFRNDLSSTQLRKAQQASGTTKA